MLDCPGCFLTTYTHHFKPKTPIKVTPHATKILQTDEPLISQHYRTTLQVSGKQPKSKVWPKTSYGVEEYKDYLKRLEHCKKELFRKFYACPCPKLDIIERMLRDLEKSTYQIEYSPNEFVSRRDRCRHPKTAPESTHTKYYATTYGTYYNRIRELERFKDALYGALCNADREQLRQDLKAIYKLGVTTYHVDICVPAIESAKSNQSNDGPIDRYTLRRI